MLLGGVDAFFYFYFFDDLYYIEDIQQAFKNICLDKMLSDGYFDMSAYIFGRLKKEDIYARLVASKSRYAVLYQGRFPNKNTASSVWRQKMGEGSYNDDIYRSRCELTYLESSAIVNWVYKTLKNSEERNAFTKELLGQIKELHGTLLETVRDLKALGIDVFFEEQSIHTLSADGELMLSILASYAQEESLSASENQKWRVRKNFEEGKPWNGTLLGYRYRNGVYVIEPDEAETVRRIFREYLSGKGIVSIANDLNADGVRTRYENACSKGGVSRILHNYAYSGNLLLQKTFRENHLTKKTVVNEGQLPMYHAEGTHEAIISLEDYQAVQAEIAKRAKKYAPVGKFFTGRYPFSSLITCAHCGKHYRRKITATGPVWICSTYNYQGRAACPSKQIPEPTLTAMTADLDIGDLTEIIAEDGNTLVFRFKDGRKAVKRWHDRSRAKSWTPEMKEAARQKAIERNKRNG